VRIFNLVTTDGRIDWIVTNDLDLTLTADVVKAKNDMRWTVEEQHGDLKQLTGIEQCERRSGRAQRNHIGCAYQAYVSLKVHANKVGQTVYAATKGI
jgi:SRSO17 transposase